jgi:ankyrin repeat protein
MDNTQTHIRCQRADRELLEVNGKLFVVIRKRNISVRQKVKKIKKLLGKKPQPDINAQDSNDNLNSALHLAIESNELEVVKFLLSQGSDTAIENGDGKTPLRLAEELNHMDIVGVLKSGVTQVDWPHSEADRLASHISQPFVTKPN